MEQFGAKFIFQGMPRLLTLWFEIGALQDSTTNSSSTATAEAAAPAAAGGSRSRGHSAKAAAAAAQAAAQAAAVAAAQAAARARVASSSSVQVLITRATHLVQRAVASVPAYMWYTCLPQLMSRLGHPSEEVSSTA
jgi:hypothetical protein